MLLRNMEKCSTIRAIKVLENASEGMSDKMQYNTILQLLAALTNVIGTTYAVLSILKLKPEDLYSSITLDGMDKNDDSLLTQKRQARIGIGLVMYAWILQAIVSFLPILSKSLFWLSILVYVILTTLLCIGLSMSNKRFAQKYSKLKEQMDKENNDRHRECHMITDL